MWDLEPLWMTMYVYIYIDSYRYTSMKFQSAVRLTYINYLLGAYVTPILASVKTSGYYMAYYNIIPTLSWLSTFMW